jgi:hypothetical protein
MKPTTGSNCKGNREEEKTQKWLGMEYKRKGWREIHKGRWSPLALKNSTNKGQLSAQLWL